MYVLAMRLATLSVGGKGNRAYAFFFVSVFDVNKQLFIEGVWALVVQRTCIGGTGTICPELEIRTRRLSLPQASTCTVGDPSTIMKVALMHIRTRRSPFIKHGQLLAIARCYLAEQASCSLSSLSLRLRVTEKRKSMERFDFLVWQKLPLIAKSIFFLFLSYYHLKFLLLMLPQVQR